MAYSRSRPVQAGA